MHDVCALARRARAQRYTSRLISVPLPHGAHRGDRRRQSETRTSWAERYDTGCQWRHAHAKMALEKGPRVRAPRLLCIASPRIPPETRHHPVSASFAAPDARSLVCATARFYYKPPVPRSTCPSPRALGVGQARKPACHKACRAQISSASPLAESHPYTMTRRWLGRVVAETCCSNSACTAFTYRACKASTDSPGTAKSGSPTAISSSLR